VDFWIPIQETVEIKTKSLKNNELLEETNLQIVELESIILKQNHIKSNKNVYIQSNGTYMESVSSIATESFLQHDSCL
jgi:hypothetical protein